jgi:hypothetical protein
MYAGYEDNTFEECWCPSEGERDFLKMVDISNDGAATPRQEFGRHGDRWFLK